MMESEKMTNPLHLNHMKDVQIKKSLPFFGSDFLFQALKMI
jgi:hypothetical protein